MSHDDLNEAAGPASRRDAMKLGAGVVALGALARMSLFPEAAQAQTQPKLQSLKPELWKKTPWTPSKRGNFDLAKYSDNHLATMKITNNLVGERTYIPMITRALLGPQGKAPAVLYGHVGMWIWQLQEVDLEEFPKAVPGAMVQRAMYTGMILDPKTYEPVETVYNHVLDRHVKVEDSLSAETYVFNPGGGGESVDRAGFMKDAETANRRLRPMARFGDDICLFLDGIFSSEGPHQPRMDTSIWTMNHDDLMNPDRLLQPVDYNFAGLMRAWERSWTGFSKPDETQILWNVKGTKMHSLDRMPDIIKRTLLAKYPDRI